jgi:hypothetical protein
MTAAGGWDGAAAPGAARRVLQPSAACSLAARGHDGVLDGRRAQARWRGAGSHAWMAGEWQHCMWGRGESAPMRGGQLGACADVGSPDPLVSGVFPLLPLLLLAQSCTL